MNGKDELLQSIKPNDLWTALSVINGKPTSSFCNTDVQEGHNLGSSSDEGMINSLPLVALKEEITPFRNITCCASDKLNGILFHEIPEGEDFLEQLEEPEITDVSVSSFSRLSGQLSDCSKSSTYATCLHN